MFSTKIHTTITVLVASAGFVLASSGVASAIMPVQQPVAVQVVTSQPTTVAQNIDPSKVGSANDNYSDQDCETLAKEHNEDETISKRAGRAGNSQTADDFADMAAETQSTLEDNCFVID